MVEFPTYPYKDPLEFKDLDELLIEINNILVFLEANTHLFKGNYKRNKEVLRWYDSQVAFLKGYYEQAERLVIHEHP